MGCIGSDKADHPVYDDFDEWMTKLADRAPTDGEIIHTGLGWGALEEMMTGKRMAPGATFPRLTEETVCFRIPTSFKCL